MGCHGHTRSLVLPLCPAGQPTQTQGPNAIASWNVQHERTTTTLWLCSAEQTRPQMDSRSLFQGTCCPVMRRPLVCKWFPGGDSSASAQNHGHPAWSHLLRKEPRWS